MTRSQKQVQMGFFFFPPSLNTQKKRLLRPFYINTWDDHPCVDLFFLYTLCRDIRGVCNEDQSASNDTTLTSQYSRHDKASKQGQRLSGKSWFRTCRSWNLTKRIWSFTLTFMITSSNILIILYCCCLSEVNRNRNEIIIIFLKDPLINMI